MTPEVVTADSFQTALWVSMLFYVPLSMMFWHAPALVHWYGMPAVKSLFFSFMACWRNLKAFGVYVMAWGVIFMLQRHLGFAHHSLAGQPSADDGHLHAHGTDGGGHVLHLHAVFGARLFFNRRADDEAKRPPP
jgi:hypothetical protein